MTLYVRRGGLTNPDICDILLNVRPARACLQAVCEIDHKDGRGRSLEGER